MGKSVTLMWAAGLALAVAAGGCHRRGELVERGGDQNDLAATEEVRDSYQLAPGAQVSVSGINGEVKVEAAEGERAELYIVRSARQRRDLQRRRLTIEHTPERLEVRFERERASSFFGIFGSRPQERQTVVLKVPRGVQFAAKDVNGRLEVGEIAGVVRVGGVNGRVVVSGAAGSARVESVNGNIELGLAKLNNEGVSVKGVNGNVKLWFTGELNADVRVRGINGRIEPELPNLKVAGAARRGRLEGRVGAGGSPVEISGVNGNILLARAETGVAAK